MNEDRRQVFHGHDILARRWNVPLSRAAAALGWGVPIVMPQGDQVMTIQAKLFSAVAVSCFAAFAATGPAQALTTQECSAKYQAAKTAGTLAGQKWNDFRKAQCGADAAATPAAAPAPAPAAPKAVEAKPAAAPKPAAPTAAAAPAGPAVFPSAVDAKYSKETAGKARMHTCVDQYNANKASNGNGGMKWIEKGGGYYSECNKKLKG
jgi:hypothetical protein